MTRANELALQLSERILRHCHEQALAKGERLTERKLAEEFDVSRSPIRSALRVLEDRGLIARSAGGYTLAVDAETLGTLSFGAPPNAAEDLYVRVLRDRFAGHLGEHVSEADLIRRYDVTRGTLNKALMRLNQEGYLTRSPGRGWTFAPTLASVEAYRESYEFRLAIEPAALNSPNYRVDKSKVEQLLARHHALLEGGPSKVSSVEWFAIDAELHEMLVGFSGNQFFIQAMRTQNQLRRVVEIESFYADERVRDSFDEHVSILNALLADDRTWAATLLTRHLKLASESTEVFLGQS